MKLGVSYNLFDGIELLPFSLGNIRSCAQYISVVYQDVSNFGNISTIRILPVLEDLKSKGLIDAIIKYEPILKATGHINEIAKRNIGLESCKINGMTHFMTVDCDEFYKEEELEYVKNMIDEDGYDSTACQMQTYYKTPEYRITPPETYYVPLISKIDERVFKLGVNWPMSADPTRKLDPKKIMFFMRNKIEMHHYSYVRSDIRAKLNNSSANKNWKDRIEKMALYHDNWIPGTKALFAGTEERYYDVEKVENIFNINI